MVLGVNAQQRGSIQNRSISDGPLINLSTQVAGGIISSEPANTPQLFGGCASDTLLFEDFQSQVIPATWPNQDIDGLTDANGRPGEYYVTTDFQTTIPGDTNYVAASSSWFTPAGIANNGLITDVFVVCDPSVELIWKSAPFEGLAFMDGYTVSVVNATTSVITIIAEFAEGDAAGNIGPGIAHTNFNGLNGVLQEWSVSLAPFIGQSIAIFFNHDSDDDNLIMLDDIFVGIPPNTDGDVAASQIYRGTDYTYVPLSQNQPITPNAVMTNQGGTSVTNPTMTFDAWLTGSSVYNSSEAQGTLAGGASSTFTASAPGVLGLGGYLVTGAASADEADQDPTNNIDTAALVITDTVYGRDDNVVDGALSIGATADGFLGNQFEIFTETYATSISAYLYAPQLGDTIYFSIYNMVGGVPTTVAAVTSPHIFGLADTSGLLLTLPIIGGSTFLAPGDYVVGVEESVAGEATLAYSFENYQPGSSWVFFLGVWNNSESYGLFPAYIVRLNLCNAPTAGFTSVESGLTSSFTNTSTSDFWLSHFYDFGDGSVDTSANPVHTYAGPGTYTVCLIEFNYCGADTICQQVTVANPVPSNDTCGGALPISCGAVISGDNLTATANDAPSSCTSSGNGVWYTFTGDGSIVTLTTCSPNTDFDTEIIVVSGDCNNQACEVFNDDDIGCANGNLLSTVTFASTLGVDYFVHVGSYFQDFGLGNFELSMFCTQPCSLDGLTSGTQGSCDGITDTYSQDVVVTYSSAPATGTLDVNGQSFAITGSPQTVTLTGLLADGLDVDVTASFSADGSCPLTGLALFTAPASCLGSCDGKAALIGFPTDVCANSAPIAITPAYYGGTFGFPGVPGPIDVPYINGESANSFSAASLPLAIPDNVTPGASANIFVSGVDPNSTLGSICMDITHTWDGDLHVTLMDPSGTSVDLMARPGSVGGLGAGCSQDDVSVTIIPGTGNDMENVCITGVGIIGEYTAHDGQDIASFSGDPNGLWVVTVIDSAGGDIGTLDNFTLNFGNPGMLDVTGLAAGTYDFTHTYSTCDGCVDIDTISFNVLGPAPVAAFNESASNLVVDYTDASTGPVDNHFWDFGDGNTSTFMDPQHTYAAPGTYTVCLIVSNSCGADTTCQSVSVTCPVPVADFTNSANNLIVDFTDASTGTVENYLWDFGDGNTSVLMNPQHTYAAGGTYTVCLTVSNSCGADSSCSQITISCPAPVSAWSSSTNGLVVDFTDLTAGTVDTYLWDFGDGNTSGLTSPQHTYAVAGTYTVCQTVVNACGADSSCASVNPDIPTSLDPSFENGLSIYPNPSEGNITLELNGFETEATISIVDVTGRVVYTEVTFIGQNFRKTLNLNVANGSYVLHLITDQGIATRKLEIE